MKIGINATTLLGRADPAGFVEHAVAAEVFRQFRAYQRSQPILNLAAFLPLPAWLPLSLWIGFQAVMAVVDFDGDVSWAAHVGGIVAGAILVVLFRRRGVPLFDRDIVARTQPS